MCVCVFVDARLFFHHFFDLDYMQSDFSSLANVYCGSTKLMFVINFKVSTKKLMIKDDVK